MSPGWRCKTWILTFIQRNVKTKEESIFIHCITAVVLPLPISAGDINPLIEFKDEFVLLVFTSQMRLDAWACGSFHCLLAFLVNERVNGRYVIQSTSAQINVEVSLALGLESLLTKKKDHCGNVGYRQFSSVLVESVFNSSCFSTLLSGADFSSSPPWPSL